MVVKVGRLKFMDRFAGVERAGGVLGFSLQVLIFYLVFLVGQFRGVARRLRLSLVNPGLEIRHGYLGHLQL